MHTNGLAPHPPDIRTTEEEYYRRFALNENMAPTKHTIRPHPSKPVITWTRFYLPLGQEWPVWAVHGGNAHLGPLLGVDGIEGWRLGRMVDKLEQAVYIIGIQLVSY